MRAFNNGKTIEIGTSGLITISDCGKWIRKTLEYPEKFSATELEITNIMGKQDFSPSILESCPEEIIMEYFPGYHIWSWYRKMDKDPECVSEKLGIKMINSVVYIHKYLRIYHGDCHVFQFIIGEEDDFRLVDFGESGYINDDYTKAVTDIRKIRRFCGLERFQNSHGIIGEIAKLFVRDREIKGHSKKSKLERKEIVKEYRKILNDRRN